ncbi:MAG: lipoate--protein ligase family protein, partial [Promethearchaeota archaeon]
GLMNYNLKPEKGIIHCPALFINGKKFSGNAQKREKGYVLQHGTILLDLDPELMYSVLKAPNNVSKTRMVKSVYAKCIGIKEKLNDWDEKKFLIALKKGFEKALRIKLNEGKLSEEEQDLAKKLVEEKYKNKDWLKKYE